MTHFKFKKYILMTRRGVVCVTKKGGLCVCRNTDNTDNNNSSVLLNMTGMGYRNPEKLCSLDQKTVSLDGPDYICVFIKLWSTTNT